MNESNNEKLHRALDLVAPSLVEASPQWAEATTQWNIQILRGLIFQEPVLAFELICHNLEDGSCSIAREAYELLEELGESFHADAFARSSGLKRETWERLKRRIA